MSIRDWCYVRWGNCLVILKDSSLRDVELGKD